MYNIKNIISTLLATMVLQMSLLAQVNVDFTVNKTDGCGNLQAIFIDNSTSANSQIVSWDWDLAGIKTSKQNPGRIFDVPGNYTICLTVTDANGNKNTLCKENYINIYHLPKADFAIDQPFGCSPITAKFKDFSSSLNGDIIHWTWDIGGSANVIDTDQPGAIISSTYTTAGLYSMSLSIKDEKGCTASTNKKDILHVKAITKPVLRKTYVSTCGLPWIVNIVNENIDPSATYHWIFGNGQTYNGATPPQVVYYDKGSYDLKLIISNSECTDTLRYPDFVNTNSTAGIIPSATTICLGESVSLTDMSELFADSVRWDFGDGLYSTNDDAQHIYTAPGCYKLKLLRFRGTCTDTLKYDCLTVRPKPVPGYFIQNQFACTLPTMVTIKANGNENYTFTNQNTSEVITGNQAQYNILDYGKYYINIDYKDQYGCVGSLDSVLVDVQKFEANLPSAPVGGCIPYSASLSDSIVSAVPIQSYNWTLFTPQKQISILKNPQFAINKVGEYDLQLIVTNTYGCKDTIYRNGYVRGGTKPTVDFIASPLEDCLVTERTFTDLSSSNANFWIWDFGDGSTSNLQNSSHIYGTIGSYDISLTAVHNGCAASKSIKEYINILEPVSNYGITYDCQDPYTVTLNNLTLGADSLFWQIGPILGTRDTILDSIFTSFTFPERGKYILGIYSKNFTTGCEHNRIDTIVITDPTYSTFEVDTTRGCAPLKLNFKNHLVDSDSFYFDAMGLSNVIVNDSSVLFQNAGTYQLPMLVIRDVHECLDTISSITTITVNGIKATTQMTGVVCVPDVANFKSISTDTFSNIVSWEWTVGDTLLFGEEAQLYLSEGKDYTVKLKVTDDWNCSDSISLDKGIEAVLLDTDFESDTLGCTTNEMLFIPHGDNINTVGYEWDFGDGETSTEVVPRHQYKNEGEYSVCLNLKDGRGCENMKCKPNHISIRNPKALFTGDPRMETCPPLLTTFVNQSINATNYEWNFGDQSGNSYVENPSHIYFEPDNFDVSLVAIRSELCRDTLTLKDYITVLGPKAQFSYEIEGNCTPLNVHLSVTSDDYYSYFWDFGNGVIDTSLLLQNSDEKYFTYNDVGTYVPKIKVTDNNGCARTFSADEISVNDLHLFTSSFTESFCELPSKVNIENLSTSSNGNVSYEWILSDGQTSISIFTHDFENDIFNYGSYDVTLHASTENCKDTLVQNKLFEVGAMPVASFDLEHAKICEGIETTFVNTSSISNGSIEEWIWDFGDGTSSAEKDGKHIFQDKDLTSINLTVISDKGCKETIEKPIEIEREPAIVLSSPDLICLEDSATIIATVNPNPFISHQWSDSINNLCSQCTEIKVSPSETTTFFYSVLSANGCVFSDSVTLKVAPIKKPELELSLDTMICLGSEAILNVLDFNPAYVYQWFGLDPIQCNEDCSQAKVSPKDNAIYIANVKNIYGCETKDSLKVEVEKSIPDFLDEVKFICEGNTTFINANGGNNPIWGMDQDLSCINCDTAMVSPSVGKLYFLTVQSDLGCTYKDSIRLELISASSINAGQSLTVCKGEKIVLNGIGIGDLTWTNGMQSIHSNGAKLEYYPTITDDYTLTASIGECVLMDSLNVEVLYKADIEAVGDTVCYGDEAYLEANGLAYQYNWYDGSKLLSTDQDLSLTGKESKYISVVGSRTTCISDTQMVYLKVFPKIEYTLNEHQYKMFLNNRIYVDASYDATANYSYAWTPANALSCDDCPVPSIYDLNESSKFNIEVTDENSGCTINDEIEVRVKQACDKAGFYIPNIFKPGSGNENGEFFLLPESKKEFLSISILDRWGNVVFKSDDSEFVWDGTFNGTNIGSGVYVMVVKALCPETNEVYNFGQDLTIIR